MECIAGLFGPDAKTVRWGGCRATRGRDRPIRPMGLHGQFGTFIAKLGKPMKLRRKLSGAGAQDWNPDPVWILTYFSSELYLH